MNRAYVTGVTGLGGFPATAGAFDTTANPDLDAFVVRLSADGSTLEYATYLGGSSVDAGRAMTTSMAALGLMRSMADPARTRSMGAYRVPLVSMGKPISCARSRPPR